MDCTSSPSPLGVPDALAAFLGRFERFCVRAGLPEGRVSRALFGDQDRIAQIRATPSDIGVKRLAQAETQLEVMATDAGVSLAAAVENGESDAESSRPLQVSEASA